MRTLFPHVSLQHLDRKVDLDILIAGCGTGQHSIETAERFPQSRILAVDLSLASLCYASRKTFEVGLANVRYAQADILNLHSSDLEFDVIEATGILHHLEDTTLGWHSLLRLLRAGGVMRLGLYSKLARRKIARVQDFVMKYGFASTPQGIRSFRRQLSVLDVSILNDLARTTDFYSVSGCRDALFNVMEHQTDLLAINRIVTENKLEFLGFNIDESVI